MPFASTDQPHGERNDNGEDHDFRNANTKHGHTIWMVVLCTAITALIATEADTGTSTHRQIRQTPPRAGRSTGTHPSQAGAPGRSSVRRRPATLRR